MSILLVFVSGIVDQQLASRDSPELVAERELEKWDRLPLVAPLFMSDPESGAVPIKLADYHLNLLSRGALTYLPRAALAAQGKQGSAANTERQFRGVAFVNDLRRVNMKHPTIARLSYICENKRHVPPNRVILTGYKRRIVVAAEKRKAAGKRRADDDDASAPAEATAADAGDAFDFSVDFDSAAAGAAAAADAALDALVSIMNDREELVSWAFGEAGLVGAAAAGAGDGEGAAVASAIAGARDDDAGLEAEVVAVQTDAAGPLPGPGGEWQGLPPGPLGGAAAAAVAAAGAPDLAAAAAPAAAAAAGRD